MYDTIVVGAGAAGCMAAATLARAGRRVLLLEAQSRVGGRVHTAPFGDGVVELGAEWIHGVYPSRVFDAAATNKVPLKNQVLTFKVYKSDGTGADDDLVRELTAFAFGVMDDPPAVPEPLGQYVSRRVIEYINENHPTTDKSFINSFLFYMDLLVDNYEASNTWNDVSTASKYETIEGHQHVSWHRHGYKTFFEILLNTYNNGPGLPTLQVLLGKEVSVVTWPREPAGHVTVTCADGSVHTARDVIVTVSLGVLKERHKTLFSPSLPDYKTTIINDLSMGVMDKVVLAFDHPWWPAGATFFGFLWDEGERARVGDEWVTRIFACSTPMGSGNCLTLWTSGETAKLVETLPEDVVRTKVMALLRRFLGRNTTIPEPTAILRSAWHSNPHTRGSYSYDNVLTPLYPTARVDLAAPVLDSAGTPRVLFAGEATHPTHYSTVHGAAETGHREAVRLLSVQSKI